MSKSFEVRRSPQGMTVASEILGYVRQQLSRTEKRHGHHGREAPKLRRFNSFLDSCGIAEDEREWVMNHAHLTKCDFVGLLSILLYHTGLAPARLEPVIQRGPRVVEVR